MTESCQSCGSMIEDWDASYWARNMLCITCYERKSEEEKRRPCMACGARLRPDQLELYKNRYLCHWCAKDAKADAARHECAFCHKWIDEPSKAQKTSDGKPVCAQCVEKNAAKSGGMRCYKCGEKGKFPFFSPNGKVYCEKCADDLKERNAVPTRPLFSRVVDKLKVVLAEK